MPTYTANFDSLASGAPLSTLSGWQNELGTSMQATSAYANSGANSIKVTNNGDACVYTGLGPLTESTVTCAIFTPTAAGAHVRIQLRSDGSLNWYELIVQTQGTTPAAQFRKRVAGTDSPPLLTGSSATAPVAGNWYWVKVNATGSGSVTVQGKLWKVGTTEPASYEFSMTDKTGVFTSGYPGLRLENSGDSTYADDFSVTSALPLTAGTASVSSRGDGVATVTSTPAAAGIGGTTYQWYRGINPMILTGISGATSLTFSDMGLINGTAYYYQLHSTDGITPVIGNLISVVPAKTIWIGLIGDSWNTTTTATGSTTQVVGPQAAGNILQAKLQALYDNGTIVNIVNAGVGGTNASQWAPGSANMLAAEAAFLAAHSTKSDWIIQVHLGINDSSISFSTPSGGETAAQYKTYMQAIATGLLSWGAGKVVFIGPPCIGAVSANHTANGVLLLSEYFSQLQALAATDSAKLFAPLNQFPYFANANTTELGGDNVHPTPADANGQGGATNVATKWAKSLYIVINGIGKTVSSISI